jgi:hypothetical protein
MASLSGATSRWSGHHVLADEDRAAAVAEIRGLAGNRPDLLAEHAGVCLGMAEAGLELMPPQYRLGAELAIEGQVIVVRVESWAEWAFA